MRVTIFLLALASSTLAYTITFPNNKEGWTDQGPQTVEWQRVVSDRKTFDIVLENQGRGYGPVTLAKKVDGTLLQIQVNSPRGGWPTGDSFRVNFVQNGDDNRGIEAQSKEFAITSVDPSSTSTTTTSTTTTTSAKPTRTPNNGSGSQPGSGTPGSEPGTPGAESGARGPQRQTTMTGSRPGEPYSSGSTAADMPTESNSQTDLNDLITYNSAKSNVQHNLGILGLSLLFVFVFV